jgi:glutamyl/glutaminyl-tRNA synthetase
MLDFKSAVVFLRPFLELAIKKNYTKDEIFQLMGKVGWSITQNTFKYFWNLYLLEEENSSKKKSNPKSAGRAKTETSHSSVRQNKINALKLSSPDFSHDESNINEHTDETQNSSSDVQNSTTEINTPQISFKENHESGKSEETPTQQNSAHFDLLPDSEDL